MVEPSADSASLHCMQLPALGLVDMVEGFKPGVKCRLDVQDS